MKIMNQYFLMAINFVVWTLLIYWMHRLAHVVPILKKAHFGHHKTISQNVPPKWHWSNLFLFQDNLISTLDIVLFELIPTILFCFLIDQWWILVFYYAWSAFVQENIEHNPNFNIYPWLTSGKWHLIHHKKECNFGLFTPIWDIIFNTHRCLNYDNR